jgi:hypothetical protein
VLRSSAATLVSPQTDLRVLGRALLDVAPPGWEDVAPLWAGLVLAALCAGCLAVLRSRVRAVEIVR